MNIFGKIMNNLRLLEWHNILLLYVHVLTDILPNDEIFRKVRSEILRLFGLSVTKDCKIGRAVYILHHRNLKMGEDSGIGYQTFLDCARPIEIGRGCSIGFRACFITGSHPVVSDGVKRRPFDPETSGPIVLEDFVWVGANATILPGITIGEGAVVAAGAVVTKNVEPHTLVAGVPARPIRTLRSGGAPRP